jgi:predicted nucleic acid-binding protein
VTVLVDSNVLLDILTEDPQWSTWSGEALAECAERSALAINPLIYAEVSIRFERIEELEDALPEEDFLRLPLPWEAAFLAGKCFLRYRRRRGGRRSPLPDFYIGAHAAVAGLVLLTRDASATAHTFPAEIIAPELGERSMGARGGGARRAKSAVIVLNASVVLEVLLVAERGHRRANRGSRRNAARSAPDRPGGGQV